MDINVLNCIEKAVINERLIDKQIEVLKKIEKKLDEIHHVRKNLIPGLMGYTSDAAAEEEYNNLIKLCKECIDIDEFKFISLEVLQKHKVMFT